MPARLSGVVVPTITALRPDGTVDRESVHRHTRYLIDGGVNGIFGLGTTGEFGFLTDDQRVEFVRELLASAAGEVPVVVGVTDTSTARVLAQLRLFADLDVAGAVVTAPFFAATASAEVRTHFRTIHREFAQLPVFAYENPPRVNGFSLATDDLLELAEDGVIAGVKDSSGSDAQLRRHLLARADRGLDDFQIFTGSELTVDAALMIGVDGVVPGLGNVDPAGYARISAHARAGQWEAARSEQERLFRLFRIVGIATDHPMGASSRALGAFKSAAHQLGSIAHPTMASPAVPFTADDHARVADLLQQHGPTAS